MLENNNFSKNVFVLYIIIILYFFGMSILAPTYFELFSNFLIKNVSNYQQVVLSIIAISPIILIIYNDDDDDDDSGDEF